MSVIFTKANNLKGEIDIPGDKSISHRSVMLGALAKGTTEVEHFLDAADCNSTIKCFNAMGIEVEKKDEDKIIIHGKGLHGLKESEQALNVGNSGTTIRLLSGILSAQDFNSRISGDDSICRRPMGRIIKPLTMMGADIKSKENNDCSPLFINGKKLNGIDYISPIASAQVKSAILFAGMYAEGETSVTEPYISRNHSEKMISYFGGNIRQDGTKCIITPYPHLEGQKVIVPGDISSAAYFMVAGLITEGSEILVKNVGINPTRDGLIEVIKEMGGDIELLNMKDEMEPCADILCKSSNLKGITIGGSIIPRLIDEIPIIAVMACFAEGQTIIKDAQELKVKESNRIDVIVENLQRMGADITPTDDGMIINGGKPLKGAVLGSRHDHRVAMSFAIAGLAAEGKTEIIGSECVNISYPAFYRDLESLMQK
ncbi:MAG: 3-phosphoshikimate 1-carboxyvinyltransferase [Lachnospiraceae bacterium]|nr:3-phosphoshikimate 1-carboxyvinyltransferase [Lachnospiraceae bacterium]